MSSAEAERRDFEVAPALSEKFLVRTLRDLVRVQSVNPGIAESGIIEHIAGILKRGTGAELTIVESLPGRPSLAAVLGSGRGPRLVLNGHVDTVGIDDLSRWTVDPFGGEVRDGHLYGRGACDMKAGLAVQIAVLHHLSERVREMRGSLVCHFAMGEECGEPGTLSLLREGFGGDYGITTEPTSLQVGVAERGLASVKIRVEGRSVHASRADAGNNPILAAPAVIAALAEYHESVRGRSHPLLDPPTCTPTVLRAGMKENAVPDSCELLVDRRLLPGESATEELNEIAARVSSAVASIDAELRCSVSLLPGVFQPAEIDRSSAFAQRVLATASAFTSLPISIYGTPFSSDVRNLINDAGIEAVTFGPGDVAECHCIDERVAIDQVRDAARVITAVAIDLLI